jgi:hypothetical protein
VLLVCTTFLLYSSSTSKIIVQQDTSSIHKFAAEENDRVLNIHVVAHTHDDVGWRKTVEQYYEGLNASIDTRGDVRNIISTVVESLVSLV